MRVNYVSIKENVERINTSFDPDYIDKKDYLCIHLTIEESTEKNVEGLNTGCFHSLTDLSAKHPTKQCWAWIINWMISIPASLSTGNQEL